MTAPWLLVAGDFSPYGGMDSANLALARRLAGRGVEVHLVAHSVDAELLRQDNVIWHRVPRPLRSHFLGAPLLNTAGRLRARLSPTARVVTNGGNCQLAAVNWVHYVHAAWRPDGAAGGLRRVKDVWRSRKDLRDERRSLGRARLVICNSRRTASDVIERFGLIEERVRVVYYGTDPDRFSPISVTDRHAARRKLGLEEGRPYAVFVGALGDRRKNFDTLFEAWGRLCLSRDWEADLIVVGSGAALPQWRSRAAEAGLSQRIHFLGFRRDVPEVLAACDVLVHPARYEAYGLSVHEALCRRVPAIVSSSAGIAERYPLGLAQLKLRDPEDAVGLAEQLRAWASQRTRLEAAAAEWSDELRSRTWDTMADELIALSEGAVP